MLALLLLNRNRRLSADRIVDALWDEPPKSARNSVQRFVADIRASHDELANRLESDRAGYTLRVEEGELDLDRFDTAGALAADYEANGDTAAESASLRGALDTWTGPPLDGVGDPPFALAEQARLNDRRLGAFEQWADAELMLGHHRDLVSALEVEAAANPFRERIWAQLISALYHSHRQADALATYATLRDTLLEELGVDPAPELRDLELRVLNQELPTDDIAAPVPVGDSGVGPRGYEFGDVIGEGEYGRVLEARQVSTGRDVAVKVIDAATADDPPFIRAFDEANKGVAGLEHPHIVPMYDWWREPSAAYVVMRLLRGGTLHGDIALADDARRAALTQVADALRVAHSRGIHHGAVMPGNVLLDDNGNAYLTDFGIGRDATREDDIEALSLLIEQQLPGRLGDSSYDSVDDLLRALDGPPTARSDTASPYKGLRAFQEADAADFFGRDTLVDRMLERLRKGRFLALIGASGSGKSSAVRAGLLPRLRRGGIDGSENWFIVDMIPGAAPLDELVRAVRRVAVDPPDDLRSLLGSGPDGLRQVIDLVLPEPGSEMVLVIDQFEELFTLVPAERARQRFIESLVAVVSDPRSRLRVVVTMRADFYDRPLASAGLGALFQAATETVIPLKADELERAIMGPAERAGITFDPGLVAEMVSEVVDQPSTLPLLQYALTEMFDARSSDRIGPDDYREVGGVLGALARRADWLYTRQTGPQQLLLRQLLLRLVTVGTDTHSDTRRRVNRAELESLGDPVLVDQVLSEFGRHRLLTFDRDPTTGEPVTEVAHEALLREWTLLRDWIEQSRDDLRQHRRVSVGTTDWIHGQRDPSFLLRGARLDRISAWRESANLALTDEEADFIRTSLEVRRQEETSERDRLEREAGLEQQANRRLRLLVGVFAVAAVVAVALSLFAFQQSRTASDQRSEAQSQARRATAQSLASAAIIDLPFDPERSLLLALESVDLSEANNTEPSDDATIALHEGLSHHRLLRRLGDATAATYSPDGVLIAAGRANGDISLLLASDGSLVRTIEAAHDGRVEEVVFTADGGRLASVGVDADVRIWELGTGLLLATAPGSERLAGVDFSPDGERFVAASVDGSIEVSDSRTGELLVRRPVSQGGEPSARWMSNERIAVLTGDARIVIVDPDDLGLLEEIDNDRDGFCTISIARESSQILVGGDPPRLIGPGPDDEPVPLIGRSAQGCTAAFSPDETRVATGSIDGTIQVWSTSNGGSETRLVGHGADITSISFNQTGTRLLSVSAAGDMFEWDVSSTFHVEILSPDLGNTPGARLTAAGDRIVSRDDRGMRVTDVATGARLAESNMARPAGALLIDLFDISTDDTLVVLPSPTSSGRAEIRSLDTLELVQSLEGASQGLTETRFDSEVEHVVGLGERGSLFRWSLDDGQLLWSTDEPEGEFQLFEQVEMNPSGRLIAAPRRDTVDLYDSASGELVQKFEAFSQLAVAWIDDERFVSAGQSGNVSVWRVGSDEPQRVFAVAGGSELLKVDAARGRLFIGRVDGVVAAWSLEDGRELFTLPAHPGVIIALSVNAAGDRILSADIAGVVHVRTLDTAVLVEIARSRLTRELTDNECLTYGGEEGCS